MKKKKNKGGIARQKFNGERIQILPILWGSERYTKTTCVPAPKAI
ncbi:MAG: hypothetical protein ACLVIY_03130 [Anaerobutyricum soehngenii]